MSTDYVKIAGSEELPCFRDFTVPAIYFLIVGPQVMYVGQTTSVVRRVSQHYVTKPPFEKVLFLPTSIRSLNTEEQAWIKRLDPPWNARQQTDFRRRQKNVTLSAIESAMRLVEAGHSRAEILRELRRVWSRLAAKGGS